MKKLIVTIIAFLCMVAPASMVGEENSSSGSTPPLIVLFKKKPIAPLKRVPAMPAFEASFNCGVLTFIIEDLYMLVTVENDETGDTYVETISAEYPSMEIGTEAGCYTITCITDQNQTFIGYLEI